MQNLWKNGRNIQTKRNSITVARLNFKYWTFSSCLHYTRTQHVCSKVFASFFYLSNDDGHSLVVVDHKTRYYLYTASTFEQVVAIKSHESPTLFK